MTALLLSLLLAACGGSGTTPEAPPAPPPPVAPSVAPVAPSRLGKVAGAEALTPEEEATRTQLASLVQTWGLDPGNAWAVGHALLALGPDTKLADGTSAIDTIFARYGEVTDVGGVPLVGFPRERDGHPVEPHAELFLKTLVDLGAAPDRVTVVGGRSLTLADDWRGALWRSWIASDGTMSFPSWNDTPWALEAIAGWAPAGASWTAAGGHPMTIDALTHDVVHELVESTAFLADARKEGGTFQKRGQGIFAFTCGGAHLIQGAAYAVARGFGTPDDRAAIEAQAHLQAWRFPIELGQTDAALKKAPQLAELLAVQRLKFTGHHLETMTRFVALGLVPADDPEIVASIANGRREVVYSVGLLSKLGLLDDLAAVRAKREQTFLDLVGDSAHALHGLDLASGTATIPY